ncbi:MAG: sucrase ferredoxin [Actinomycetota bacterium]|nr:sucrase ferredoxin [Actinomycetota bacterium]
MSNGLSESALRLLPVADQQPLCASHARSINTDPCGNALFIDALVLVEVPLPWPKPVFEHPLLRSFTSMADTSLGPTRVLAAVPSGKQSGIRVIVYQRDKIGVQSWGFRPKDSTELARFANQLGTTHPDELDIPRDSLQPPEIAVLICTQGSHDVCCGSKGTQLASDLEKQAPGLAIFRVSHTGGHRFAPTALTIPDGRMWAYLDTQSALSILELSGDINDLSKNCRGWWGAPSGPGQVAERAVFEQMGWDIDLMPREVWVNETAAGWTVTLSVALQNWTVEIVQGRQIPTITCRAEGGMPAKSAYEYIVTSVNSPT